MAKYNTQHNLSIVSIIKVKEMFDSPPNNELSSYTARWWWSLSGEFSLYSMFLFWMPLFLYEM